MDKIVAIVVRNDAGQILILENKDGVCGLPMKQLALTQSLIKGAASAVTDPTGLIVDGLTQIGTTETRNNGGHWTSPLQLTVYGFRAHVVAGKLASFPNDNYLSVSWVSPTVALKIKDLEPVSAHFIRESKWIGGTR